MPNPPIGDLTGSGLNKTVENHLNIEKLRALFVIMPIHYLIIYGYVKCDTNTLKMHAYVCQHKKYKR